MYFEWASAYTVTHPDISKDHQDFANSFQITDEMLAEFKQFCVDRKIELDDARWDQDIAFTKTQLKGEIAGLVFNNRDIYNLIRIQDDEQVQAAMGMFDQAKSLASSSAKPRPADRH